MMIEVSRSVTIPENEIEFEAVRSQGAGGQNVNKRSTAIQLRFDIAASSLPEVYKERLLQLSDSRITEGGIVIIKAQTHRTQEKNRAEAAARLQQLVRSVAATRKKRRPTKPTKGSQERRLARKKQRGDLKKLRQSDPRTYRG